MFRELEIRRSHTKRRVRVCTPQASSHERGREGDRDETTDKHGKGVRMYKKSDNDSPCGS